MDLSEHAARNREIWNTDAPNWVDSGRRSWASPTPWWGMWEIPEEELKVLPEVSGLDVLDLGCGTGYWCASFDLVFSKYGAATRCSRFSARRSARSRWASRSCGPSGASSGSSGRTRTAPTSTSPTASASS